MKDNVVVVNYIYQNVSMGILAINDCLPSVEDSDFGTVLRHQKIEYINLKKEAEHLMDKYDCICKDVSTLAKASATIMTDMKLLADKSVSHIAKMMVEGTDMGVIAISEKLNNFNIDDKDVMSLAIKLNEMLEDNITTLKKYI